MELADYNDLIQAFAMYWNGKVDEGAAFVNERINKHPMFVLMHAEEAVIKASLSEEPVEFENAFTRIAETRKQVAVLFKKDRPALRAYLANLGKSVPNLHSESEASLDRKNRLDELKAKAREEGEDTTSSEEETDLDLSADEPASPAKGLDSSGSGIDLMQVSSALLCKVMIAEAALWDASLKFKLRKYVKGALEFRSSWKAFLEVSEIISRLIPAGQETNRELPLFEELRCSVDFGMGLFHFLVSAVPKAYRWLIEGIGFKGDRPTSLQELKRSMSVPNGFRAPLAALTIAWIYGFFYYDYPICLQILDRELEKYPDAAVLHYTVAYVRRKEGKIPESTDMFRRAHEHTSQIGEFQLKMHYEIGYNLYLQLDWQEAITHLERYLSETKSEAFRAYCAFQIGFAHLMLGHKDECLTNMKKIEKWSRKNYTYDDFALRHSKKFLKRKEFAPFEKTFHCALLLHEAVNFEACQELLQRSEGEIKTNDDRACWCYLMGSCHGHAKRYEEAKAMYREAIALENKIKTETFVVPWSYCGIAEVFLVEKNWEKVELALKRADGYSGYDFESFLTWRIRKAQDDFAFLRSQDKAGSSSSSS